MRGPGRLERRTEGKKSQARSRGSGEFGTSLLKKTKPTGKLRQARQRTMGTRTAKKRGPVKIGDHRTCPVPGVLTPDRGNRPRRNPREPDRRPQSKIYATKKRIQKRPKPGEKNVIPPSKGKELGHGKGGPYLPKTEPTKK